jgi:hypothetical protein
MGTMAWCAADFRATQPRQLGAARSDFGPGTARRPPDRQEMQRHRARALCDHRRPCWQRSGRSCMAPSEPLPLGPAAAANAPLPGMLSAPGRALCAAITAAHTFTIAELFVRLGTALAAAGGGVEAQRGPAVARRPPRGCAAPGASASARLAPWKRYIYATFLGGDPRSTNLRARRSTALLPPLLPLLRATSASDANELLHFHSTATATSRPSSAGWTAPRCCGCGATSARSSRRGGAIRTAWQVEDTGPSTAARGAPS